MLTKFFLYIKPLKIYTIQIEIIQCILKYITIETKLNLYTRLIKQYRWNFYNANKNYTKQMKRYKKQRDNIELILNLIKGLYINMRYHFEINQFSIILPF